MVAEARGYWADVQDKYGNPLSVYILQVVYVFNALFCYKTLLLSATVTLPYLELSSGHIPVVIELFGSSLSPAEQ